MTIKRKVLGILLLTLIGVAYFQATTFVVKSFAYPSDYKVAKATQVISSHQIVKH
jgi:hypothetical protein